MPVRRSDMPGWSEETRAELAHVGQIRANWEKNIISLDDMEYLFDAAESRATLREISTNSWANSRAEIFAKDLEIADLVRQLKEALGN